MADFLMTLVLCVICVWIGLMIGFTDGTDNMRNEAIEHGYMEYNKTSGDLYWVKERR